MRTSANQYEMLVTYMEQHGDLNKPSTNARGRLTNIERWDELATLLNSDGSGDTKTTEKWKKVWSDFKNNTKKKAARLHRAASGTGGGPATNIKLTDLEQRVLNIIGVQAATGLPVEEVGLSQQREPAEPAPGPSTASTAESSPMIVVVMRDENSEPQPGPSNQEEILLEPHIFVETIEDTPPALHSAEARVSATQSPLQPAMSGQTPTVTPRRDTTTRGSSRRGRRPRGTPRRPVPSPEPTPAEQAAQHFLQSDSDWREIRRQQHRDQVGLRREQIRIRELELQVQRGWQELGNRAVDLLEKLVNKYCE